MQAASGETVSPATASTISTVYSCTDLIAGHLSTVPIYVNRWTDAGIERTNHPVQSMLRYMPDVYMNSQQWRHSLVHSLLMQGNVLYKIYRSSNGFVSRLQYIPITNWQMLQDLKTKEVSYQLTHEEGLTEVLPSSEVLHFKIYSLDGLMGQSVISAAANMIGLGLSAIDTVSGFYRNGGVPSGILKLKGTIKDPERLKQIGSQFDANYGSQSLKSGTAVLTEGAEYDALSISQRDSQFIETLQFTVQDIARFYHVPLEKLSTPFNTAQGAGLDSADRQFIQDCLRPLAQLIEMELQVKLFSRNSSYFIDLDLGELNKGSVAERIQWAVSLANIGVVSTNEIREKMGLNAVEGGDQLLEPLNYSPTGDIGNGTKNREDEQSGNSSGDSDSGG
jgi:HK97 family phage portal protein